MNDKKTLEDKRKMQNKALVNAMNHIFSLPEGKTVLRYIMNQSGYQKSSINLNQQTGEINIQATLYNEAWRNLYLNIRQNLRPEILQDVEIKFKEEVN